MKISILTEASNKCGLGHVVRCNCIYEEFLNQGIDAKLIVDIDDDIKLSNHIEYQKFSWLTNSSLENSDILIVDSYAITKKNWLNLEKKCKMFFYIDDETIPIISNKVIPIRFAIESNNPKCDKKLFGIKYFPIRKSIRNAKSKHSKNTNNILIMFGGTDIRELSIKLSPLYEKYKNFNFNIITGNKKVFENIKIKKNIKAFLNPDWDKLANIMANSFIAISSAGTVLYELAYLCIPTIAISVIENQEKGILKFKNRGFIDSYLRYNDNQLIDKIDIFLADILDNYDKYSKKSKIGEKLVDGNGSKLIVKDIIKMYNGKKS